MKLKHSKIKAQFNNPVFLNTTKVFQSMHLFNSMKENEKRYHIKFAIIENWHIKNIYFVLYVIRFWQNSEHIAFIEKKCLKYYLT